MNRVLATLLTISTLLTAAPPPAAKPDSDRSFARSLAWVADLKARQGAPDESPAAPSPSPAILQMRVLDGEGVVYALGSRATRGLTVQVTDETGRPVEGAAVSFRLPNEGATGMFEGGSKSEVVVTKADGRASVWGMQWNRVGGPVEVRLTAMKGPARAGAVTQVYLSADVAPETKESRVPAMRTGRRLTTLLLVVAGIAGGGLAAGMIAGKTAQASGVAPPAAPRIGAPSVILGKP